jgi:diketogulonate reductase-like aldo/keto reductase
VQYKKLLADTNVQIPEIGLGTWEYRGGVEPLQKGLSLGACLIDTAEIYGTEEIVGRAIEGKRDEVFLATKVSPEHFNYHSVITAADNSLKRLNTDHIDMYQLHWPNPSIPIDETMAAMDKLVSAGKVRFIGVSNFSLAQFKEAQAVTENKIVSNQVRYNLIDRRIERELLPYCQKHNVTIIAYSPLAHSMSNLRTKLGRRVLEEVARDAGKTEAQVALNWCISRDKVIAIPKSNSSQHTTDNCNASGWRLIPYQMDLLEDSAKRAVSTSFARRVS